MALTVDERRHLRRLRSVLDAARGDVRRLDERALVDLPRLYRYASSLHARLVTRGDDVGGADETRGLVVRSHALLHRGLDRAPGSRLRRLLRLVLHDSPQTVRAEWRVLALSFGLVYGLALLAYVAVLSDLSLAYSLLDARVVAGEIEQLRATELGEPFRGNFTFGLGESSGTAGWIMAHNIFVALLFFASGLIPVLFLLLVSTNGLMLGTYTAVAAHWGQAGAISSILWCHGTLEIQALVLAGAAGMVLVRPWMAPGPWSRRRAMELERVRAWRMVVPVVPMLVLAGLIEGFVSPHAPLEVRMGTAIVSGLLLVAWLALGGREPRERTKRARA